MMDDLIRRAAAIDILYNFAGRIADTPGDWYKAFEKYEYKLKNLPSAQPEIIHCENCKHWKNNHLCECLSRYGTFETPKDFFCGYGKEK